MRSGWKSALLAVLLLVAPVAHGQPAERRDRVDADWDTTRPRGETRTIDFTVNEGTGLSVDLSPDGRWVVFDLLASIWRMPAAGGAAENLTAASGIALDFHPAVSPDGRRIAFVSDRTGQNNLWLMDVDGKDPHPLFVDPLTKISEPAWTPDGKALVAVRGFTTPGRGWHRTNTQIWLFPADGEAPHKLISGEQEQYNSPSVSPDGRSVYFHVSFFARNRFGTQVGHRLQKLDLATGKVSEVRPTPGPPPTAKDFQKGEDDQPHAAPAATAPVPSPDGRWLAFAAEQPDRTFAWRGHRFGPVTALKLRDLRTGQERVLVPETAKDLTQAHAMYSYRTLPGYAWSADSRSILLTLGGKIARVDVATGARTDIPFSAHVHREISQMTRGRHPIDDASFQVKSLQWPAVSPDGSRIVFAAAGKLWLHDVKSRTTRPLTEAPPANTIQITPAWSPDGRTLAFAAWSDTARGQVWAVDAEGGHARQLTREPGEYAYPAWRPDGRELVVAQGPGQGPDAGQGWNADGPWRVTRIPLDGGAPRVVATGTSIPQPTYGPGGRIFYAAEDDRRIAQDLRNPWPTAAALKQVPKLHAVSPEGAAEGVYAELTWPQFEFPRGPLLSPGGDWLAYEADHQLYVVRRPKDPKGVWRVDPDVNAATSSARRVSVEGALFSSWRDDHTLQFASANDVVTYDVRTGERRATRIELTLPRFGGKGRIALTHATVVQVEPERVLRDATVLVQDARIACVGVCEVRPGDKVLDLTGKTVVPGFIDVHDHDLDESTEIVPLRRAPSLLPLAYGVTTIVDPATQPTSAFPIAEMIEAGVSIGPRTYSSADLVIFGSTMMGQRLFIRSQRDAEIEVNRRVDLGAITIKNYRTFSRDQQQKLLAASAERQSTVTGEGGPLFYDLSTIMDGQTGWEHYLADLPVYRDFTTFAGLAGITYSPTVNVAGTPQGAQDYWRPQHDFLADAKYRRFAPPGYVAHTLEAVKAHNAASTGIENFSFPIVAEGLKDILAAGGHGAIGEHGEQWGIGSHWEMWSYASALTPAQVLRIATLDGARFVGLEGDLGSITPGKIADLVVLNANPLDDIHNTLKISRVMKAGVLYDGETLDQQWPVAKALGSLPWRDSRGKGVGAGGPGFEWRPVHVD